MALGITPVSSWPPAPLSEFAKFIQWRAGGADLGDAGVMVVDFVGDNLLVTRGAGENSHIITVRRNHTAQFVQPGSGDDAAMFDGAGFDEWSD